MDGGTVDGTTATHLVNVDILQKVVNTHLHRLQVDLQDQRRVVLVLHEKCEGA